MVGQHTDLTFNPKQHGKPKSTCQKHNNNMKSQTQNEAGVVTWSNQKESDETSVECILTMVDIEIESTTPEQEILEDMIEEDDDQDDTEEEDDNNVLLFEFKEEKESTDEDTNKQDKFAPSNSYPS